MKSKALEFFDKTLLLHRLKTNWQECAVVMLFEGWCQSGKGSDPESYIFTLLENSKSFKEASSERQEGTIQGFISAIQWLATPVGERFLHELINLLGYDLSPLDIPSMLTDQREDRRERVKKFLKTKAEAIRFTESEIT